MKLKEFLELFKGYDDDDEVCVNVLGENLDIWHISPKPGYWDGSVKKLIRDPSLKPYYDVIGMNTDRTMKRKLVIESLSLTDCLVDWNPKRNFVYQLDGEDWNPEYIQKYKQWVVDKEWEKFDMLELEKELRECYKKINQKDPAEEL